jgi:hypothetical protein
MLPPHSVRPDYTGRCLSNLPSTIMKIFGLKTDRPVLPDDAFGGVDTAGADNVVLFIFDGLGFDTYQKQSRSGFMGALSGKGSVEPITTVFPSTTAAALTTASTGLTPQEHGLPEWYVYMREVDSVIMPLPFAKVGEAGRDTLLGKMRPRDLFNGVPYFKTLAAAGVKTTSFSNRQLSTSAFSKLTHRGSTMVAYGAGSDLAMSLRRCVEQARGRNLFYVYWSYIDSQEHKYGPQSEEAEVEASTISHALGLGFLSRLDPDAAKRTLILATADHGHVGTSPQDVVYLNGLRRLSGALSLGQSGKMIPPWGAPRDLYMDIQEGKLDETQAYLQEKLEGVASVLKTADAVKEGLFGINSPSKKFLRRIGNLMVLPHGTRLVWYDYWRGQFPDLRGHHGGLSPTEMTIPFCVGRASELQR